MDGARLGYSAFLHDDDAVVVVYRARRLGEIIDDQSRILAPEGIELVGQARDVLDNVSGLP